MSIWNNHTKGKTAQLALMQQAAAQQAQHTFTQANQAANNVYTSTMTANRITLDSNGNLGIGTVAPGKYDTYNKPFDPNKIEAYKMPMRMLLDLWTAKWGDVWVPTKDLGEDEFWDRAMERLDEARLLESAGSWVRLLEK